MPAFHAILSSMMARLVLGAAVLAAGCGPELNPKYCAAHPDDGDCRDAGLVSFDAPPPQCMTNADCATMPGEPACDVVSHQCVACLPNVEPTTCPSMMVCGEDFACHGCIVDTHCPNSFVCTPAGVCAEETNVLYASPPGGGSCLTKESPCTLTMAAQMLSPQRYILKLTTTAGIDYQVPPLTIDATGQQVGYLIIGTGTTFTPQGNGDAITTMGGNVEIVGLRIVNASAEGVACTNGGLALRRMAISDSGGYGVQTTGCNVQFDRNTISRNPLGAMLVDTGTIEIRNNILVENGTGDKLTDGNVQIRNVTGRFVFNTVAANLSKNGNNIGGVNCTAMAAGMVTVARNIIASNGGANNQVGGDCAISATTNYISGNLDEVRFGQSYHLTATSLPNQILNDPLADPDCFYKGLRIDDIDGQPRPVDFCDRGADEFRP